MDGILRALTDTDPIRVKYGATHRLYGGSLAGQITLHGSYGTVDKAGQFQRDPVLQGWSRTIPQDEIAKLLMWCHEQDPAVLGIETLPIGRIGDWLDHDNRWDGEPEGEQPFTSGADLELKTMAGLQAKVKELEAKLAPVTDLAGDADVGTVAWTDRLMAWLKS